MKKNGPSRIIITTYKCTPCKYLEEYKTQKCCNHKTLIENNINVQSRLINNDLVTPCWCPVFKK